MKVAYAHIMIVDDDGAQAALLAAQLRQFGYATEVTADIQQAISLTNGQGSDLILLSAGIAARDQFAGLQRLRQEERLHHVPIVILTPAADLPEVARAIELGANDYLQLPASPVLIKTRIRSSLERKQLRQSLLLCLEEFNEIEKLADDLRLVILPLGIALTEEKSFDRLLEQIVIEVKSICNADAGTLYLRTGDEHLSFAISRIDSLGIAYGGATGQPVPYGRIPLYDSNTGAPNYHNVAAYVALEGQSVNIDDIYNVKGFDFSGARVFDASNNYRSNSCLTVPLKNQRDTVIGVLQLLNGRSFDNGHVTPFTVYHQLVAESLASQAAVVLRNHMLRERQEHLLKLQRDLQIGRQIQDDFLPAELPQPPGWELAACFRPAREVAGDFYDAFTMPHGKIGLIVADVCGKGVPAALFMALVRSLLRAFIEQRDYVSYHSLAAISEKTLDHTRPLQAVDAEALLNAIRLTNAYIGSNHRQTHMFATLFFGVLDTTTGHLVYVNGGHTPPVILKARGLMAYLKPTGPAIGLTRGATFQVGEVQLTPDDVLFAYTDGVTEARDAQGEPFTQARLRLLLEQHTGSAEALLDTVEDQVRQHIARAEPFDDITMLAVRRGS